MTMKDCQSVFKMLENVVVPHFPFPHPEYENAFHQVNSFTFNSGSELNPTPKKVWDIKIIDYLIWLRIVEP